MEYGIQLYSVRDLAAQSLEDALRTVSGQGYRMVEFAGFFGHSAEMVKGWLEKYNLRVSGTHTGWKEVAEHFEETAAYHRQLGNDLIIVPGADLNSQEKISAFVEMANEFQPRLQELGIRFAYHNHDHEFRPNGDGSVIMDQLIDRTSLLFELDTYWAYAAGKDPLEQMERLGGRLVAIHLKDGLADRTGKPLGMGTAPVRRVHDAAMPLGLPVIVESETLTPDGVTEAALCMDYLRSLR